MLFYISIYSEVLSIGQFGFNIAYVRAKHEVNSSEASIMSYDHGMTPIFIDDDTKNTATQLR